MANSKYYAGYWQRCSTESFTSVSSRFSDDTLRQGSQLGPALNTQVSQLFQKASHSTLRWILKKHSCFSVVMKATHFLKVMKKEEYYFKRKLQTFRHGAAAPRLPTNNDPFVVQYMLVWGWPNCVSTRSPSGVILGQSHLRRRTCRAWEKQPCYATSQFLIIIEVWTESQLLPADTLGKQHSVRKRGRAFWVFTRKPIMSPIQAAGQTPANTATHNTPPVRISF